MLTLIGLLAFFMTRGPSGWWNGEWTVRKKITLDAAAAGITEPIGAMPLLIRLHEGTFQFGAAKEDGSDIRFVAADNKTVLAGHLEKLDPMLGEGFAWVKVPDLKPGAPVVVWLYYGNAGNAVERKDEPKSTYDSDTVLVYHFAERGGPFIDSSAAGNNAQAGAPITDGSFIGPGLRLDGRTSVVVPASASLEWPAGGGMTWSAWIKPAALQPNAVLFSRREAGGSFVIGLDNGVVFVEVGGQRSSAGAPTTANAWRHLAVVAEGSKITVYLDGEVYGALGAGLPAVTGPLQIGGDFNGEMDELQIAKVARPVGFIRAAAMSQGGEKAAKLVLLAPDEQKSSGIDIGYFGVILKSVTVDGWVVIVMLIGMGALSWYVMVQKVAYLRSATRGNEEFLKEWRHVASDLSVLDHGDPDKVKTMGGRVGLEREETMLLSPIYRIYHIGAEEIRHRKNKGVIGVAKSLSPQSIESIRASLDAGVVRETQKFNRSIVFLTISIAGGPFLGLLGTVVGVMITFAAIAAAGEVNVNSIAPGIAAALVATVAGLGVAIPALFGYNYIVSQVKEATTDMQIFVDEFVTRMAEFYRSESD
jgi:biopolymer transport protein ExbB